MMRLAEEARRIAVAAAVRGLAPFAGPPPRRPASVFGLDFPNPLGMAAGFDRNGTLVAPLAAAGFGFVEVGTVTPHAEPGRSRGAAAVAERLRRMAKTVPVGINVGSARPGLGEDAAEDCAAVMRRLWDRADYLAINLSSPLRRQGATPARIERFLARLLRERNALVNGRRVPLLVKAVAEDDAPVRAAKALGLDGVVLVSSALPRVIEAAAVLAPIPLVSVGGIATAAEAAARLAAGAALVQVYNGFVRAGPRLPRRLVEALP